VDNKACNRATIETLIKAGAFDSTGCLRSHLFQWVESALKAGQGAAEDAAKGQGNLFGGDEEPMSTNPGANAPGSFGMPKIPEWSDKEKSNYEKEVLGFYLSTHPLKEFADLFAMFCSHTCSESAVAPSGTQVLLAGTIGEIKIGASKNPKPGKPFKFAMFDFEDASGSVRTILWADAYAQYTDFIKNGTIVFMRGRMDRNRSADAESPDGNFIVDEVFSIDEAPQKLCQGLSITFDEQRHTKESVDSLLQILLANPGVSSVKFSIRLNDGAWASFNGGKTAVSVTPLLYRRITDMLGENVAKVLVKPPEKKQQNGWRRG
jgi:DNA polymerase-3 subunit alpha